MGLFSGKFGLRRCRANRTLFEAPLDAIQEPVQAELEEVRELTAAKSGAIQSRFACCSELPKGSPRTPRRKVSEVKASNRISLFTMPITGSSVSRGP